VKTLVRGARLLGRKSADLLIDGERIVEVGSLSIGSDVGLVDADGLVALPGLVDLHAHLREPGREDTETVSTGTEAAAAGGFTAILAMANTNPVTDTAEAANHLYDLGRATQLVDVQPVGAVTKGLAGEELAELGLMARSRARVRLFSDDGHCVSDARVMRRALEYVKAFGGVVSQHAQDPRLAGADACAHESELSGRLGLPGWPGIAEESIVARDVMLARHTGSPRPHRPRVYGGFGRGAPLGQGAGHRRDRGGHPAPPAAHPTTCSPLTTRSGRSTLRCGPRRTCGLCGKAWRTGPSTLSPPTTPRTPDTTRSTPSSTRAPGMLGLETALGWSVRSWSGADCSTGPASPE
jgi:hypothetical protein